VSRTPFKQAANDTIAELTRTRDSLTAQRDALAEALRATIADVCDTGVISYETIKLNEAALKLK
jgi:hypothetical protein